MGTISTLKDQAQADIPILLFRITSRFTGAKLFLSTHGNTAFPVDFGGDFYAGVILRTEFSERSLFAQTGIDQPEDIALTLGDVDSTYKDWNDTNLFHYSDCTVTVVFWNPNSNVTSTDSLPIFQGLCDAPESKVPNEIRFRVVNKLQLQFIPIPQLRVSRRSPTIWPAEGVRDSEIADAWDKSESDRNHPAWPVGYGPLRGIGGFAGANPIGDFRTQGGLGTSDSPTTADIFSSTTIGKVGLTMTANLQKGHIVAIMGGTGAPQAKRIKSNTGTTITIDGTFSPVPDGTSQFVVCWGFSGGTAKEFKDSGMFDKDFKSRVTRRFRGLTFLPVVQNVRLVSGERIVTPTTENVAKYTMPVPVVYGQGWVECKMLFSRGGNQLRFHLLVCEGEIPRPGGISKLRIEGKRIPFEQAEPDPANATGSWRFPPNGRGDKADANMDVNFPGHDPYNLLTVIYGHVPPEFTGGREGIFSSQAFVKQGEKVEVFNKDGNSLGYTTSENTVWIFLDMLKTVGFKLSDLYLPSFHSASEYAKELISQHVSPTKTQSLARFRYHGVLDQQRSASEALRGARMNARLITYLHTDGTLGVRVENKLADTTLTNAIGSTGQQFAEVGDLAGIHVDDKIVIDQGGGNEETVMVLSVRFTGSTVTEFEANFANTHSSGEAAKGQIAYTFDDSNVLYREGFGPAIEGFEGSITEVPNDYTAEFSNEFREDSQDGGEILSAQFANLLGAKTIRQLPVDGLPNTDAFVRMAKWFLNKTLRSNDNLSANIFLRLQTTVKAVQVKIGDIVDVNLTNHGWASGRYRIVGIRPTGSPVPHENIQFTFAGHDDTWYDDINGQLPVSSSGPSGRPPPTPPDFPPLPPGCSPEPSPRSPGPGGHPRFGPIFNI